MSQSDRRIQRLFVERLRVSSPAMIQVLTQDIIRQHIERIEPACVADLFALSEAALPLSLATDLKHWSERAAREILDLPDGDVLVTFLAEIGELPPEAVPASMRAALAALIGPSSADTVVLLEQLFATWADIAPTPVVVAATPARPVQEAAVSHGANAAGATRAAPAAKKAKVVKTPAALIDPRRAEWIREDSVTRLSAHEYAERGLKENVFVAGIKHRCPYKDVTEEEIKSELRRLERERKLKHTGERWLIR